LGSVIKKTLNHPKADQERRALFCQKLKELKESGQPITYIDESGFAHDMPRTHGYSLRGERCFGVQDWGARGRTNVIGALLGKVLLTISLFQATINTAVFNAWLLQDLIPVLPPHSIVVMDNATFHKSEETKLLLENNGHTLLYLPPYSPDFNPIEHKWAQAKKLRRKTQCTIQDLFMDTVL
jgi:hypothetical protein